jgi:Pvc16 N-terminal domain
MLQLVDESIEDFLRATVPDLAGDEVEVAFEAPDSEWGAGVTKPTVNLFLWDVRRNLHQRDAGMELLEDQDGKRHRRPPLPRIACHYLVTAWTADVGDEHRLLGALLTALLTAPKLPAEHLRGPLAELRPLPSIEVADPNGGDSTDFWSALGGRLKPGLDMVVTVSVDAALLAEAGPPADRFELALDETNPPGTVAPAASSRLRVAGEVADPAAEGAVVRSPRGSSRVREGRFVVPADPGDEVVIDTDPPQRQRVGPKGLLRFTRRARR